MERLFGEEKSKLIWEAMEKGRSNNGITVDIQEKTYAMNIVPIRVDGKNKRRNCNLVQCVRAAENGN